MRPVVQNAVDHFLVVFLREIGGHKIDNGRVLATIVDADALCLDCHTHHEGDHYKKDFLHILKSFAIHSRNDSSQ